MIVTEVEGALSDTTTNAALDESNVSVLKVLVDNAPNDGGGGFDAEVDQIGGVVHQT